MPEYDIQYILKRTIRVIHRGEMVPDILEEGTSVYEAEFQDLAGEGKVLVEFYPPGIFDVRAPYLYEIDKDDLEEI